MGQLSDAADAYRAAESAVARAERDAARRIRAAKQQRTQARLRLAEAIQAAYDGGMRQVDIAAETGYSREWIRRITRSAD